MACFFVMSCVFLLIKYWEAHFSWGVFLFIKLLRAMFFCTVYDLYFKCTVELLKNLNKSIFGDCYSKFGKSNCSTSSANSKNPLFSFSKPVFLNHLTSKYILHPQINILKCIFFEQCEIGVSDKNLLGAKFFLEVYRTQEGDNHFQKWSGLTQKKFSFLKALLKTPFQTFLEQVIINH